jgi:tetratricopeptide (TPR) repeat protein
MLVLALPPSKALPQSPDDKAALAEATRLNQEAFALYRAGKYTQAEPLLRRALAIREKALGPEHPDVATSLENYAALLRKTNRATGAEAMEDRAKVIRTKRAKENPTK